MKSDQLIQSFVSEEQKKRDARNALWLGIRNQATKRFAENCKAWLGEFLDEILPAGQDVRQFVSFDSLNDGRSYRMHVTGQWRGAEVSIRSGVVVINGRCEMPHLQFAVANGRGHPGDVWQETVHLPYQAVPAGTGEYDLVGSQIAPIVLGEALARTMAALEVAAEHERKQAQDKRERGIERHRAILQNQSTPDDLDEHMMQAIAAFPELAETFETIRNDTFARFERLAQKEKDDQERQERIGREIERLEAEALKRFRPFVVYRVIYGANSEDGDDWYTQEAYTAQPEPNADGWWPVLQHWGKIRYVRFHNVLSVERHEINSPAEAPLTICARDWLKSDVEGVGSIEYFYIPEESGVAFKE